MGCLARAANATRDPRVLALMEEISSRVGNCIALHCIVLCCMLCVLLCWLQCVQFVRVCCTLGKAAVCVCVCLAAVCI